LAEEGLRGTRCRICLGNIREGQFKVSCACGNDFHETCASRLFECPICKEQLQSVLK
jgi:hypothetical protein